jgi:hypothetical protein
MGQTIAQKIFDDHRAGTPDARHVHVLRLDAVFCHEITTPPAIVDLEASGQRPGVRPGRIKAVIDHVIAGQGFQDRPPGQDPAGLGPTPRHRRFLRHRCQRGLPRPFPEKGFVRPGYTIIMGDSHTCTHGAFGAFAAGVGTTDLEVGILKGVCAFKLRRKPCALTSPAPPPGSVRQGCNPVDHRPYRCQRRHQQGDRICRPRGGGHGHGIAHDPVQHGHRSRRDLRYLRTGPGHRGLPVALYQE